MKTTNEEQTKEFNLLKDCSTDLKQKANAEALKLDGIDQYSRRQNLEFAGVPVSENENVVDVVVKIGKLVGVNVKPSDISTAHRLPTKRYSKISKPPAIIARFISRNVRNHIYRKRVALRDVSETELPVPCMEKAKLFINENLTQARKRLLRQSKQAAKKNGYAFVRTMNGKIYVRKNDNSHTNVIVTEKDLKNFDSVHKVTDFVYFCFCFYLEITTDTYTERKYPWGNQEK